MGGKFRLSPNQVTRKVFLYCLALAADNFNIDIHCLTIMCNHYHLVVTANHLNSDLAKFMHCLNLNTALVFNDIQEQRGTFWTPGSYHLSRLNSKDAVMRAMVYVICNPVQAGLVRRLENWPGFVSTPGMCVSFNQLQHRPAFFGQLSEKDESIRLRFVKPPQFANMTNGQFIAELEKLVRIRLDEIRAARRAQGLGFLGAAHVRNQHFNDSPDSNGVIASVAAFEDNCDANRFYDEEDDRNYRAFCEQHEECLEQVRRGERPIFPYGTYKMVVTYGYPVAPAPEDG